MNSTRANAADEVATYEVCLRGALPESLRSRTMGMAVHNARPQTVLFRWVRDVSELDALLDRLLSAGLVLTEVHAAARPSQTGSEASEGLPRKGHRYYEVRVAGELGDNLLCYLGWSHRLYAERQVARGDVSAHELNAFLSTCSAAGVVVDRVRRMLSARTPATLTSP